jgi:metallo-beta-lactamase family protein
VASQLQTSGRVTAPAHPTVPLLRFLGATGTVTGSRFLIQTPQARVLVDCGLFQGLKPLRLRNWEPFPVDPASIDAVVLTHAHLDHCGYLPALTRLGFRGPIFATPGTETLARIVLPDSAHIQEEDASYANRKGFSKHRPALPLYTSGDAEQALGLFRAVPMRAPVAIAPGVSATFRSAGHILGSATVTVTVDGKHPRTVLFSGDLGRPHHPIFNPPDDPPAADVVVIESTYGDREHEDVASLRGFEDVIVRTAARGGTIVIPSFAVDRTEVLLLHLRRLTTAGTIPKLPVYVDSPMALATLAAYRRAIVEPSAEIRAEIRADVAAGIDPFDPGQLIEATSVRDSMAINEAPAPKIIVSASGMASGGRVLHHLAHHLPDPASAVLLAGYQAEGTRGRALADGARELKLLGRYVGVRAEIVSVPAFSVHADRSELVGWLKRAPRAPETTFIVHGEPAAAGALHDAIERELGWTAAVPRYLEHVRID